MPKPARRPTGSTSPDPAPPKPPSVPSEKLVGSTPLDDQLKKRLLRKMSTLMVPGAQTMGFIPPLRSPKGIVPKTIDLPGSLG